MLTFVSQKNVCNKLHELELYEGKKGFDQYYGLLWVH